MSLFVSLQYYSDHATLQWLESLALRYRFEHTLVEFVMMQVVIRSPSIEQSFCDVLEVLVDEDLAHDYAADIGFAML